MKVHRATYAWMVLLEDPAERDLFEAEWIPTAFTAKASFEAMKKGLEGLNPGQTVEQV